MPIGVGHKCDIWRPNKIVSQGGSVLTSEFSIIQKDVDCRFHGMKAAQRIAEGVIDLTKDVSPVVFKGENLKQDLQMYDVLFKLDVKTGWIIDLSSPAHSSLPLDRWVVQATKLKVLVQEIEIYYGL